MVYFAFLPIVFIGVAICLVAGVSLTVEFAQLRRERLKERPAPLAKPFRPRVIQGGKQDPPASRPPFGGKLSEQIGLFNSSRTSP